MPDIALDKASFISLWVETICHGMYSVLFFICVYVLLYMRRGPNVPLNKPMLVTTIVMYAMSTAHIAIGLYRGIAAFIDSQNRPHGALIFYEEIWEWHSIFKQALYATNNIVADGLVVYRCYIVWGKSYKVVVVPIIMLIATSICAYAAVYNFSQIHPGQNVFATNIAEWGTALFSLSLSTNIIITGLIAGRLWWASRETSGTLGQKHTEKYTNAIILVVESGAIYSVSLTILLILYCQKTNAQYIAYDALAQIMGIVPTLIIVRVGLGLSSGDSHKQNTMSSRFVTSSYQSHQPANNALRMNVRKVVEVERDDYLDDFSKVKYSGSRAGDHV